MKCSLSVSNFLEEMSSLSHSVVFLYFFALVTQEGFLISPCYSLELTFYRLVATAEFSKFAGILSAARSQYHLLGSEIAHLEFCHLH